MAAASNSPSFSVLNSNSNSGFYNAPVSKALLSSIALSHIYTHLPVFKQNFKNYFICSIPECLTTKDFWKVFTCKFCFVNTKDAVFAALLVYYFRTIERRYGSKKFGSHLLGSFALSLLLEILAHYLFKTYLPNFSDYEGILSVGPLGLVFPMFVSYYKEIPRIVSGTFGGFSVSPKFLTYLLGLQLMGSSISNAIASFSALFAGYAYRANLLYLQKWLKIPEFIAKCCDVSFGSLIKSSPPESGIMGATLDIQRTQQVEYFEQQRIRSANRQFGFRNNRQPQQMGQGFAERLVDDGGWRPFRNFQPAEPSEDNIRLLMDMGFSRERVIVALRQNNNDIQGASTSLLQDI